MLRLLMFGIMATPVYIILGGGLQHWWPLNILFTLCLATTIVYLLSLPTHNRWAVHARIGSNTSVCSGRSLGGLFLGWAGAGDRSLAAILRHFCR